VLRKTRLEPHAQSLTNIPLSNSRIVCEVYHREIPPLFFHVLNYGIRHSADADSYPQIEIFLPSYANYDFQNLETKRDPVQEIVVTDEEVANMFPS
jgi:hypothetical protein